MALEPAVGQFHPTDDRRTRHGGQLTLAPHHEEPRFKTHLGPFGFHSGKGDLDVDFVIRLIDVGWRFPGEDGRIGAHDAEELPMDRVRAVEQPAGLRPHPDR